MTGKLIEKIDIPPASGKSFVVKQDEILRIIDNEADIPDPLNVFMHAEVVDSDRMLLKEPLSKAGDFIDLRAEKDNLVALSACAADCGPCNSGTLKPLRVEIYST